VAGRKELFIAGRCVAALVIGIVLMVPGLNGWLPAQDGNMAANELAAIRSLRATKGAQASYAAACANGAFAVSYLVLGTPPPDLPAGFITKELGSSPEPSRDGYAFRLAAASGAVSKGTDCGGKPVVSDYYATAVPVKFGVTGSRSFAMKSDGVIWQSVTAVPPKEPFGPPATKVQ